MNSERLSPADSLSSASTSPVPAGDSAGSTMGSPVGSSVDALGKFLAVLPAHLSEAELTLAAWHLDAVNEVLEWAQQQVGADPAACLWLGQLRMARLVGLPVFEGAPPMLSRPLDAILENDDDARARARQVLSSAFPRWAESLLCERMGTRSHPLREAELASTVERDGAPVLRALPLALLSYLDEPTRVSLMQEAVAITEPWESEWELISSALAPVLGMEPSEAAQAVEGLLTARRGEGVAAAEAEADTAPMQQWTLVSEQFLKLMTPVK